MNIHSKCCLSWEGSEVIGFFQQESRPLTDREVIAGVSLPEFLTRWVLRSLSMEQQTRKVGPGLYELNPAAPWPGSNDRNEQPGWSGPEVSS